MAAFGVVYILGNVLGVVGAGCGGVCVGGGGGGGLCWVGDFVLRGPNPFLKSDQIVMRLLSHG